VLSSADRFISIVIQFEDFKSPFWSLERYRNTYTVFNDDIQGTGAVILGGLISAFKRSSTPLKDQKLVFMGAGSAATGVAEQICGLFMRHGIPEADARKMFWLVDSRGLVTKDRGDELAEHKVYFAREDNAGEQFRTLQEVVEYVKPTALIGLCTIGGVFTEAIVRKMAELNSEPIIFPLSNPSVKSECTFEQAMEWTDNRVIFASGSPFPSVTVDGVEKNPGQGNNMYVFPGIGLGTILCEAAHVTPSMIYASAAGLAASLNEEEIARGDLYPELRRVREVSVIVAREVIRAAQKEGVDRHKLLQFLSDKELDEFIISRMYDPKIIELPSRSVSRAASPSRHSSPPGSRGRPQL
jgi:malate dehydrogenase (oxaloacetate-decarboxylating)(NADP+)